MLRWFARTDRSLLKPAAHSGCLLQKATNNNEEDAQAGRLPREMSRPATSTRAGFIEAQGAGTQVLMSAELAVRMGVPIYAVLEHVSTATDKIGRSVPAPGQGILTTARESRLGCVTFLLVVEFPVIVLSVAMPRRFCPSTIGAGTWRRSWRRSRPGRSASGRRWPDMWTA